MKNSRGAPSAKGLKASMRRKISVAIQKKRAKRDQNLPEINQLCVVYEISLINLSTKISVLLKKNMLVKDIADTINVHYSNVYRELKCSKGRHHYREHYYPKDAEHTCDDFRKQTDNHTDRSKDDAYNACEQQAKSCAQGSVNVD